MLNRLFGLALAVGAVIVGTHGVGNFTKTNNQTIIAPRAAAPHDAAPMFDVNLPDLKPCPIHFAKKKTNITKKKAHHRKSKAPHHHKYHPHKHHHKHHHHAPHRIHVHAHHHAPHTGPPGGCH